MDAGRASFRGREKDKFKATLRNARDRFVEECQSTENVGIVVYDRMTREKSCERFGHQPEEDGHSTRPVMGDGKLQDSVFTRKQEAGTFRFQVREGTSVSERETHHKGKEFREGQAHATFESLRKASEWDHKNMQQSKVDKPVACSSAKDPSASHVDNDDNSSSCSPSESDSDIAAAQNLFADMMPKSKLPTPNKPPKGTAAAPSSEKPKSCQHAQAAEIFSRTESRSSSTA